MNTVFGPVAVPNPRWHRCACQETGAQTFRPTAQWLTGHTSPELLYLETKWASLIPYAKVVDLLQDVLPVTETLNQETVRQHLHATATKMEQALGEEQDVSLTGPRMNGQPSLTRWTHDELASMEGLFAPGAKRASLKSLPARVSSPSGAMKNRMFLQRNGLASCKPTTRNPGDDCGSC